MLVFSNIRQRFLEDAVRGPQALHKLETSWDIRKNIDRFRKHEWQLRDLQYAVAVPALIFSVIVMQNPPFYIRFAVATLYILGILIPITSQFWLPALPVLTWLLLFASSSFIGAEYRPCIFVRVLPAWETILYGGNLSEVLSKTQNSVLDVLAWIPYGLVHYGAPFVMAFVLFIFGPPSTLPCFAFAFGWMNFTSVLIQLCFPTAPPWYLNEYGLDPASYEVHGSPAGLARVDKLLGLQMYTGAFNASPLVFGAFPSLHSGFAVMQVLFLCHLWPSWSPLFLSYILWIWWSTMYLSHHYFIDLIAGACIAFCMFYSVRLTSLPNIQPGKFSRWHYDYIVRGITTSQVKFRKSVDDDEYIELPVVDTETQLQRLDKSYRKINNLGHNHTSSLHLYPGQEAVANGLKTPRSGGIMSDSEGEFPRAHLLDTASSSTRPGSPSPRVGNSRPTTPLPSQPSSVSSVVSMSSSAPTQVEKAPGSPGKRD